MIIFKSQWVGCAAGSIMSDFVSLATVHSANHICIIIIIIIFIVVVVIIVFLSFDDGDGDDVDDVTKVG